VPQPKQISALAPPFALQTSAKPIIKVFCRAFFKKATVSPLQTVICRCKEGKANEKSRQRAAFQTVEKGAERRKVIAKRDKKQTLPIK